MTKVIQEASTARRGIDLRTREIVGLLMVIGATALISWFVVDQAGEGTASSGAAIAESYRQYAEAMELVPVMSSGAATAESYRQYAEAMRLVAMPD